MADTRTPRQARRTTILLALTGVLLLCAALSVWANRSFFDADHFADRAVGTLDDDDFRQLIAERLADGLVGASNGDLIGWRPILVTVAGVVIDSPAFKTTFRAAVADAHHAVFDGNRDSAILDLTDAVVILIDLLESSQPELAAKIPDGVKAGLIEVNAQDFGIDTIRIAERTGILALVFPAAAAAAAAAAMWTATDRRRAAVAGGFVAAGTSVVIVGGVAIAGAWLAGRAATATGELAIDALWSSYSEGLARGAFLLGAAGMTLAAIASTTVRNGSEALPATPGPTELLRRWSIHPESDDGRLARGGLLVAAGLFVVLQWMFVAQMVLWAAGFLLVFAGLRELLALARGLSLGGDDLDRARLKVDWPRRGLASLGFLALVVAAVAWAVAPRDRGELASPPMPFEDLACNGHVELCDRRLDQVTLAGTHNAMSSAAHPGWLFAEHTGTIADQLDAGVRALLIDTYYGVPTASGVVVTRHSATGRTLDSEAAAEAAARLAERAGVETGEPDVYLCHNHCELGAVELRSVLGDIRAFLDGHPREVLVVVIEDSVRPDDAARAFEEAGLGGLLFDGLDANDPLGDRLPTLGEMIDSGRRLFVMAERERGDVPWMYDAFTLTQETPFRFETLDELTDPSSCDENRGRPDSPLFQINHWVTTDPPSPRVGEQANGWDVLYGRAVRCARARGLHPAILAVDWYESGDLMEVVAALNGIGPVRDGWEPLASGPGD